MDETTISHFGKIKATDEENSMNNLALTFYSALRMPIVDIIECAKAAESTGFAYVSVAESFYRDGAALASAIASNTRTIKFGTSVFPIYTRTPFQLAMSMATLHEISRGRTGYLGLGGRLVQQDGELLWHQDRAAPGKNAGVRGDYPLAAF
jgi:alkanesulfonate monooxygenase SsuD/methylene tetrahydromethanopterin reductase-like flavin-dependent oxidoreductase (luciferase family)